LGDNGLMARVTLKKLGMVLFCLPLICATFPVLGQSTVAQLEQQLQDAVAQKDWPKAVQIVDRLIPLAPQQARQLKQYRTQLEQLSKNTLSSPTQARVRSTPPGLITIKRRQHGVPVIDVQFNRRQSFEMLVDSGASLTVITRPMATALGLTSANVVQTITAQTANGSTKMPIVYVSAVTVGGLTATQVPVAIAGPDLEIGLLGQDFLQRYDVNLKTDRIEFHDRR
jgi:aspartyl protease family protein